jgi:hypothetical protein
MGTLTKMFSSQVETMKSQVEAKTGEEVIAAGEMRQGRKPSMAPMLTGTAPIELSGPRRSKSVPKHFVLALTPTRAVAYGCVGVADDEDGENYRAIIRDKEHGSWPREGSASRASPACANTPARTACVRRTAGAFMPPTATCRCRASQPT